MKKWLIVSLMIFGIVLLPSSLRAPSTNGHLATQSQSTLAQTPTETTNPTVYTVYTVYTKPDLKLNLPFKVASRWASLRGSHRLGESLDSERSPSGVEPGSAAGPDRRFGEPLGSEEGTLARRDEPPSGAVTDSESLLTRREAPLGRSPARRGSANPELPGIWWNTNDGEKYFAIEDGKFISTDPTDTWFIYGWFGPLTAIKEDYNIKYPEWQNRHNGIDFAGREGIEVVSASSGKVTFAGNKIGNTVVVDAGNGYRITYSHLQDINVKVGEKLAPSILLGHLGSTGTVNPHLHFEIDYIKGKTRIAINPVPLIDINWDTVLTPDTLANVFYAGPADPAQQLNFTW